MPVMNKSNEIQLVRVYDAPVKAVWEAWTDEEQVSQWWGPRGFSITTHSKETRTGGHWRLTMHGPDGVDYLNVTNYLEVVPYSKLHYDHGGGDETKPLFRVTVNFSETAGNPNQTTMDMSMVCPTPEAAEQTRKIIKNAGGESTWDRLAEFLEKRATGTETFVINRSFDAPIDLMFEMWTDPEHFAKWLGPTGSTMEFIRPDIKPGGTSFYSMSMANGVKMYGRCEYLEIRKPDRIVYIQNFCDENEQLTHHPMMSTWPAKMLTTVQLAEEGKKRTRVTVTWKCYGETPTEEMQTFINAKPGVTQGWTGSFDKLEAHLENN